MTIIKTIGITKFFPGVLANDHIDLDLRPGEVHTLLGENGAEKNLSGFHRHMTRQSIPMH
jgi:ABC-type uncharacterized transport system ATPase subunit